jgi:hypothetical protein
MSYTKDTAVAKTAFWSAYLPGNAESPMKIALKDAIKRDPTPAEMAFRYRYNEPAQCHKCHACHAKRMYHACHAKRRCVTKLCVVILYNHQPTRV